MRAARHRPRDHKLAATLTLAGLYAGFATWTYFAWYRKGCRPEPYECTEFIWGKDGAFGANTYAGGADKLGHAWATRGLARLGTELLQWGGYSKTTSVVVGAALSEALFLGVEYRDGYTYQFSYWDFAFNTLGALLAAAEATWPRVDELVGFRVAYVPSAAYRPRFREGNVDVAEDYSGQTYLLTLQLGGLRGLRASRWGWPASYLEVGVGFETRNYKPDPPAGSEEEPHRQTLFLGVSLDVQGVLDRVLRRRAPRTRKVTHGLLEVFAVPYTTLRVLEGTRVPEGPVDMGGA